MDYEVRFWDSDPPYYDALAAALRCFPSGRRKTWEYEVIGRKQTGSVVDAKRYRGPGTAARDSSTGTLTDDVQFARFLTRKQSRSGDFGFLRFGRIGLPSLAR